MATSQSTAFGTLLRRYRARAGLTQERLAERAGLSARAITALERGVNRAPQRDTFRLLADALGLADEERAALEAAAYRRHSCPATDQANAQLTGPAARIPLVGRAREMALIQQHLAGVGPSLMLLTGEPGIGKSRLLQEAALLASARGMAVLEGGCSWDTCHEAYAPLINAVERHLALESPAQQQADLRDCVWITRLLPQLAEIAGVPTSPWPLTPDQERRLAFGGVARFIGNIAGPGGSLLLIDDLQWFGPDVTQLLLYLLQAAASIRLRVIAAYRDTDPQVPAPLAATISGLAREGMATRVALSALAEAEANELLARLLAGSAGSAESAGALLAETAETDVQTRALLLARGEGVPFYLVSCAQALRAGAMSQGVVDEVPWDIGESVRQRLAVLPETAQDLICVAAVVGPAASGTLLAQAAGHSHRETLAALDAACHARLLTEDSGGTYRFTHDIIWEVVVADLGTTRRQLLHRRIAETLEQERGEHWLEALAYHYAHSDQPEKALPYLEKVEDLTLARLEYGTTVIFCLEHLTVLRAIGRELDAARVNERLDALLRVVARNAEAINALTHAAETYRLVGDEESLRRVTAQIGLAHTQGDTADTADTADTPDEG